VTPALIVLAKAPEPGRAKTRLTPPCSPAQAAALAEAALADTLEAVGAAPTPGRRILALDGRRGTWLPPGWEVVPQRGGGLDQRLANAFVDVGGAALLVGMDTPQATPALVGRAVRALASPGVDAVLGAAADGGYWAVGLREPDRDAFVGVPMSAPTTFAAQRRRLRALGLRVTDLVTLRDVDTFADAVAVAARAPWTRFARTLSTMGWPGATVRGATASTRVAR
jgi:rSAM/selenodomain-associated transferase 1